MATYSGSDKRIKYLFENGGGGGSSSLAGLSDVNLSSPADGEVLTFDANNNEWINAAGGSGGSNGMCYLNTMYSETEEKVGYWIDGKPLYQLTVELSSEALIQTNSWYTTSISNANIDNIIFANGINAEGSQFPLMANCDATGSGVNYVQIGNPRYGDIRIKTFTIQYTKTTDTPEVPQRGNVIYLPTVYSQEEREVGVWKDGKPLYQKTYAGLSLDCNNANTWYNTNILLGDIDVITSAELVDDNRQFIAGVVGTMSERTYLGVYLSISGRTITTITIQYTKTTDSAGSGSWTPSGANTVHYSTNEQVVGTWVDGKTLYEKTFNFTAGPVNTYNSQDLGLSENDIDTIFLQTGFLRKDTSAYKSCVYLSAYTSNPGYEQIGGGLTTTNGTWQFYYRLGNDVAGGDVTLTVRYTKTP